MSNLIHEELFVESKPKMRPKLIGLISALIVAGALFGGYAYLRQRYIQNSVSAPQAPAPETRQLPKAIILVDDAKLKGSKTLLGGAVRNISTEKLSEIYVELELKRLKDNSTDRRMVSLEPAQLEPGEDGRYSLELQGNEYGSARLVGLRSGPELASIPYTTSPGEKRPREQTESKTIIVNKPRSSKHDEFLNSPDNPARVP